MKQARGWITAAVIAFLVIALMTNWFSQALAFLGSVPWFVYLIVAAILYSGYKFVSLSRNDQKADQEWIEEEGNVFIRRMEQERERREHTGIYEEEGASSTEEQYVYDQDLDGH